MAEKRIDYNRNIVVQETAWWCGPAATQIVLDGMGIKVPEAVLAAEIEALENPGRGDDKDGTDYINLIEQVLDRRVPAAQFTSVSMPNDPPTQAQKDRLWADLVRSIMDNNTGVVINIVAPPRNRPVAIKGSVPPPYPPVTTYHYAAIMGLDTSVRAGWIADSAAFGGITGWWAPFDGPGSICSLIPPKGYCYAAASVTTPRPVPPAPPTPAPAPPPLTGSLSDNDWLLLKEAAKKTIGLYAEHGALLGFKEDIERIKAIADGRGPDISPYAISRARAVMARVEAINKTAGNP